MLAEGVVHGMAVLLVAIETLGISFVVMALIRHRVGVGSDFRFIFFHLWSKDMKKIFPIGFLVVFLLVPIAILAYGEYGSTHEVRTYEHSDGTVVEQHQAGNPGSGVHCHDNSCE